MDHSVSSAISGILRYGLGHDLLTPPDVNYCRNRILEVLRLDACDPAASPMEGKLDDMLAVLLDDAAARGLDAETIDARDRLDTAVMGALLPPPSFVSARFWEIYERDGAEAACDWFYRLEIDANYIRAERIKKDIRWSAPSPYGQIELSINLAKPEKDPREIAAAGKMVNAGYPSCLLCPENEGYAGRPGHPARQNHRIIPLTLQGEPWGLQFSPYVYYNQHCIVLSDEHTPMRIDRGIFRRLCQFAEIFPHWFIGSNAGLPISGGSILSHEHFQGGGHHFPMERAAEEHPFTVKGVEAALVRWPLAVIRLRDADPDKLCDAAEHVLTAWERYADPEAGIVPFSGDTPHNTITPIVRRRGELYEMDLALRNNLTSDALPMGIFHPHPERHHIKRENIGLIEVMGLAVLPARLSRELKALESAMLTGNWDPSVESHRPWAEEILRRREVTAENVADILREETAAVFVGCLEDCGVFGNGPEREVRFRRFLDTL